MPDDAALRAAMAITESPLPMGWSPEQMAAIIRREYAGLVEIIAGLLPFAEATDDEGPSGEGWQSDRLLSLLAKARSALKDAGAK